MIYTIDTYHLIRGVLIPSSEDLARLVWKSGNIDFIHVGYSDIGLPLIECNIKPEDSELYGVKWIASELTA